MDGWTLDPWDLGEALPLSSSSRERPNRCPPPWPTASSAVTEAAATSTLLGICVQTGRRRRSLPSSPVAAASRGMVEVGRTSAGAGGRPLLHGRVRGDEDEQQVFTYIVMCQPPLSSISWPCTRGCCAHALDLVVCIVEAAKCAYNHSLQTAI